MYFRSSGLADFTASADFFISSGLRTGLPNIFGTTDEPMAPVKKARFEAIPVMRSLSCGERLESAMIASLTRRVASDNPIPIRTGRPKIAPIPNWVPSSVACSPVRSPTLRAMFSSAVESAPVMSPTIFPPVRVISGDAIIAALTAAIPGIAAIPASSAPRSLSAPPLRTSSGVFAVRNVRSPSAYFSAPAMIGLTTALPASTASAPAPLTTEPAASIGVASSSPGCCGVPASRYCRASSSSDARGGNFSSSALSCGVKS